MQLVHTRDREGMSKREKFGVRIVRRDLNGIMVKVRVNLGPSRIVL